MSAPLSNLQKREIGIAAHAAWLVCPERETLLECNAGHRVGGATGTGSRALRVGGELSATAVEAAWRHVEQGKACGIQSLRECSQAHYGRLKAHFQGLLGERGQKLAGQTLARDADNDRRIARYKLDQALHERGLSTGYAVSICRRQYRCALDQATAQQLWRLVYTVRSRRKAAAAPGQPKGEVPW